MCDSELPYDFYSRRPLLVRFSDLDFSSDAGILLASQAEEQVQVCRGLAECIQEWLNPILFLLSRGPCNKRATSL